MLEDNDEERLERSDFSGDDESEDDDYQPENDDEGDIDEQWSENSSGDSDMEVAFDDSDDDWNGDGGLYDVEVTTTKDSQKIKQSVPTERVQGEFSGSVNKYPLYKSLKNMKDYKWEVGTIYVDRNAFKECVTSYAVHSGRGIWFSKCDSHRCKVVCKEGCKCKATKIGIMSSQWLSKAFMKKICENPKIKLRTLIKKAHSKWNVDLTKTKAVRVKQQALDEINGTYGEQYRRIHDYAVKLLRSNPGSTVQIQVERPPEFQLETPIPAIGWDPNDQILPIAYAVVEAETKDSWRWFLLNLCDDLGVDKIRWCTFMSDQQKGLIPTFDELLPGIDHRFCVKHLYSNFRKRFPCVQLKMMMWKAAKATYVQE
ncbi:uncharacterized protein LOC110265235 [Arachis ipaensis]|uniref:uncharacterized protein LOC110265235 n=1 Tax=Arachis ipaensis TaxID=130454 RepID=UPI000A2B6AA8|nr:uncharacterized protein LOC110265235 [Arachis ipaensis]XP_025669896.1 uncharacterized protein LOC112769620 [Arachis hypogaea]